MYKLFLLEPGEPQRLFPFFGLYFLLLAMLTMGDGVALSLFVNRVGAEALPPYYGVVAAINGLIVLVYILFTEEMSNLRLFQMIVAASLTLFSAGFALIQILPEGDISAYGLLFIGREVSFTLVLLHFGTFLQDYFTRKELLRFTTLIYAGGRLGGVLGGFLLAGTSHYLGIQNFIPVYASICFLTVVVMVLIYRNIPVLPQWDEGEESPTPMPTPSAVSAPAMPPTSDAFVQHPSAAPLRTPFRDFVRYAKHSKLLLWFSLGTLTFIMCRWSLNFEYNRFYQDYFQSEDAMATFLGQYMGVAMLGALFLQLFGVPRLIQWWGIVGCFLGYVVMLIGGFLSFLVAPSLVTATTCRFIESELRTSFRNPVAMMISNQYATRHRKRARAISMGFVIPVGTALISWALVSAKGSDSSLWMVYGGILVAYLLVSIRLVWVAHTTTDLDVLPNANHSPVPSAGGN